MSPALSYLDLTCHTPCWQIVRSHQEKKSESRDSVFHMLDAPDFKDRIKSGENREVVGHAISKGISVERDRDNKTSPTRGNWHQSLPYTVQRCRNGLATCTLSHSFRTLPPQPQSKSGLSKIMNKAFQFVKPFEEKERREY